MTIKYFLGTLALVASLTFSLIPQPASAAVDNTTKTKCRMTFNLKSWSVFYKSGKGQGTITCDNGQSMGVKLRTHGGGVSFGKSAIENGHASFTRVRDISEVLGGYAQTEAHAGASKSAGAQALWNGKVGLTLSGTGKGWDLGFSFGKLKIEPDIYAEMHQSPEAATPEPSFESRSLIEEDVPIKPKKKPIIQAEKKPEEKYELFFENAD